MMTLIISSWSKPLKTEPCYLSLAFLAICTLSMSATVQFETA